jgi:hypothetical protein
MRIAYIILALICLSGCASLPDPKELIYVGVVTDKECTKLSNKYSIITVPLSFKVQPLEAARTALSEKPSGCLLKTGYGIYADKSNYYIVNNNLVLFKLKSTENLRQVAIVVSGQTGEVISRP